jgi:hypothetical protein
MQTFCGGFSTYKDGRTNAYTANFRGYKFLAHDTHNIGGSFSDWLLECVDSGQVRWIEVKTAEAYRQKNNSLKPGEDWLKENSGNFVFAVTDDDVKKLFEAMIR